MKNFNWNRTWVGFVIGILTPVLVYAIYYFLVYETGIKKMNVSLCIAANLIPFYLYQRSVIYAGLKGVFIATLLWAALIIFLSFFTNYLRIG